MSELKRLLPYFKRYKNLFLLGILFITLSNTAAQNVPRVIGSTIDVLASKNYQYSDIYLQIGKIFGLTAIAGVFLFATRRTIIVASRKIEYDLRKDFVQALERQSLSYFQKNATGEIMAYSTNDIAAIREFIGPAVMYSANTVSTFMFALTFMLMISPKITMLALIPLPLISYSTYRIGRKVHNVFKQVQDTFAKLTSRAQEIISGIRVIRAYSRADYETDAFSILSRDYLQKNIKLARFQTLTMPLMTALVGVSQLIVLLAGGYEIINNHITIGDLTKFFIYLQELTWPVIAIGWVTNLVQRASASTARLGRIFDAMPEIADSNSTDNSITSLKGTITFVNVSFRYAPELPFVFKNITFTIQAGETVAIVGETGAGKSTFVNLIPRLYDVTEGQILLDGIPLRQIPLQTLRSAISVVPQESFLFSTTIAENIRFGKPTATENELSEAIEIAQLTKDVVHFEKGLETVIGERGITLSGGQKQRASIARAVIRRPSIIIFDDALSAVDTETEEMILRGLRKVMNGRTSLLISHRISTVKNADKIIVLDDGTIAECGTHEELVASGGHYAEMVKRQLLEEEIASM